MLLRDQRILKESYPCPTLNCHLFEVMGLVANITVCSFETGHIRIFSKKSLNWACTDCSFVLIIVLDFVFLYYICL